MILIFILTGCSLFICNKDKTESYYSDVELLMANFSMQITSYYAKNSQGVVPDSFDGDEFVKMLQNIYPEKSKVELIKNNFKIKAKSLGKYYSVVLCDPSTNKKILEDFSCTLTRVDIRYWDKPDDYSCDFDINYKKYCP